MKTSQVLNAVIIEDDQNVAEFYALVLSFEGYETQIARHGYKALDILNTVTPHLVLVDMMLPDMTGDQILDFIHQEERLRNTWIIIITGEGQFLKSQFAEKFDFGLIKPIDALQLQKLVERIKRNDKFQQDKKLIIGSPFF